MPCVAQDYGKRQGRLQKRSIRRNRYNNKKDFVPCHHSHSQRTRACRCGSRRHRGEVHRTGIHHSLCHAVNSVCHFRPEHRCRQTRCRVPSKPCARQCSSPQYMVLWLPSPCSLSHKWQSDCLPAAHRCWRKVVTICVAMCGTASLLASTSASAVSSQLAVYSLISFLHNSISIAYARVPLAWLCRNYIPTRYILWDSAHAQAHSFPA